MKAKWRRWGARKAVSVIMLLCIEVASLSSSQSECRLAYIQHPPAGLTCRPERWLSLVCEVQRLAELGQGFHVVWFEVLAGEAVPVLLSGSAHSVAVQTNNNSVLSTLIMSVPLKEELVQIFCQIKLDDGTLLERSQPLMLSSPSPPLLEICGPLSLINTTHKCVKLHNALAENQVAVDQDILASTGPPSSSPTLSLAFYVVVGIIVVFVLIIVTLTVIVVLLYRRKCGHVAVSAPIDGVNGAYSGHERDSRSPSPLPAQPEATAVGRYTREPQTADSPPPRPPKPSPASSLDQSAPAPHTPDQNVPPPRPPRQGVVDIYQTLESSEVMREECAVTSGKRHQGKVKFKIINSKTGGDYERSPAYQCSSPVVRVEPDDSSRHGDAGMQHAGKQLQHVLAPKYRGDYERDPQYMSQLVSKQLLSCHIPPPQQVLARGGGGATANSAEGIGNRETYASQTDTPLTASAAGNSKVSDTSSQGSNRHGCILDKYSGNYERDPVYMLNLLQSVSKEHANSNLEADCIQQQGCTDQLTRPVPPPSPPSSPPT